jgi:hypothetical protein
MAGTISCGSIVTNNISGGEATLQIGTFTWPSTTPSTGTVLKTDGSGNLSFESANVRSEIDPTATTYAARISDDIVAVTGTLATTITLPDPSLKPVGDLVYVVKEVAGTSIVTIVPFGTELISGNTSSTLSASYGSVKIYTNGINWFALF